MGRSKQSARKYEGASAPSQMACSTPQAFQQYMSCQQSAGPSASNQERIFVNHENTFSGFSFQRATTDQEFQPAIHVARVQNYSSDPHEPAMFVRLDFLSRFDGRADLLAATRAPLDAVFVVDVSGSMSCAFPDDSDRRDKLAVAVQAIERILTKLAPGDRVSIVKFNNTADVILPLVDFTKTTSEQASTVLSTLRANGGTTLHRGLQGGFGALNIDESVQTASTAEDSTPRSRRVFFLTDMESDHHDELEMIETAKTFARHEKKPSYFTVVTIGVDLSMDSVERINAVPGSRYMSVVSAREMHATLVQDFDYDIAPLAFDIHCQMPANITIDKCYGSVELQNLAAGSSEFTVSTEFPVPRSSDQQSRGGIYLLRISSVGDVAGTEEMQFRWRDRAGVSHECAVPLGSVIRALGLLTSSDDNVSAGCDIGLRKACALVRYVDTLTSYVKPTKPTFRDHASITHAQQMADLFQQQLSVQSQLLPSQIPSQQLQQLPAFSQIPYPPPRQQPMQSSQPPTPQRRSFTSYLSSFVLPRAAPAEALPTAVAAPAFDDNEAIVLTLPASHDGSSTPETLSFTLSDLLSVDAHDPRLQHLPAYLLPSHTAVLRFQNLRTYLQSELAVHCQDLSLAPGGENHNIRQTLDQIIELETEEVRRGLQRWRSDTQITASFGL